MEEEGLLLDNKRKMRIIMVLMFSAILVISSIEYHGKVNAENIKRYCVLVLDNSGSMDGIPMQKQKQAAIEFCDSVLRAKGKNYVALVTIDSESEVLLDFSDDYDKLIEKIDLLKSKGDTNITDALEKSSNLLESVSDDCKKNIIICSDGMPCVGSYSYEGPYIYDDYDGYKYANKSYIVAKKIKNSKRSIRIYTLGFFHTLTEEKLEFGRKFMRDLQNSGYYEVRNPNQIKFVFDDISKDVEGQAKEYIYDNGYIDYCYYRDNYFKESSYEYNPSLATMSLCLAMSAFSSGQINSYSNKSSNARYMLSKVIEVPEYTIEINNWFKSKPTTDSIGVIAGNKKIQIGGEDYTLIVVAIRGGGYEKEWASNFTIGRDGQHQGFNTAKNNVISFLKGYISSQNISGKVKIWLTGYSRAGATANLVGGELDTINTISSNISYGKSDIYTYCFEPPAGALKSDVSIGSVYGNIYNIVNPNDPVPYVAPESLGFSRYGKDMFLPSSETSSNYYSEHGEMQNEYNSLKNSRIDNADNFKMKKIQFKTGLFTGEKTSIIQDDYDNNWKQGDFLRRYIKILSEEFIISRNNYVNKYQDGIREVCKALFGCTDEESRKFMESISKQVKENWTDFFTEYLNPSSSEKDALMIVSGWLNNAIKDAKIRGIDSEVINNAGVYLTDLILAVATNYPNYLITAFYNLDSIGSAHYPELCLAWLKSMDKNYNYNGKNLLNNGSYRIIRINCPVDIIAKDSGEDKHSCPAFF